MNFASALAHEPAIALRDAARAHGADAGLACGLRARTGCRCRRSIGAVRDVLIDYVRAGGTWTGSETQLLTKTGGLFHLLTGSGDYQFV